MKGVIFTEMLDFVGAAFGPDMVDDIIADANPPNGGAYTAVGTYAYREMGDLVGALAARTGRDAPALLRAFGGHLLRRFAQTHPDFFPDEIDLFAFLASVDGHIHVEVRKLHPDAELPRFHLIPRGPGAVDLDYDSCRPLEALAEGMIHAAAAHFGEPVDLETVRLAEGGRSLVRFRVRRAASLRAA